MFSLSPTPLFDIKRNQTQARQARAVVPIPATTQTQTQVLDRQYLGVDVSEYDKLLELLTKKTIFTNPQPQLTSLVYAF